MIFRHSQRQKELEKSEEIRIQILLQTAKELGFTLVTSLEQALQTPYSLFLNRGEKSLEINFPQSVLPEEVETLILDFRYRGYAIFHLFQALQKIK